MLLFDRLRNSRLYLSVMLPRTNARIEGRARNQCPRECHRKHESATAQMNHAKSRNYGRIDRALGGPSREGRELVGLLVHLE
jgi:hypothetical protein